MVEEDQNQGKKTSDILAGERTFLAWLRTGIAVISLGFVVARFSFWLREIAISNGVKVPYTGLSLPIGLGMIAFGGLMTILAASRFHTLRNEILTGRVPTQSPLVTFAAALVIGLAVVLIVYLIVFSRQL